MRFGGRVQAIDGVGREADRGVEAETARRPVDVVVDRLRHADQTHAPLVELVGDSQRAVAADADERVELHLLEHLHHAVGVVEGAVRRFDRLRERIAAIDGAENGAAQAQDAGDVFRRQHARFLRVNQPVEAVLEPDDGDVGVAGRLDDRADDGVEARRVTAACQDAKFSDGRHAGGT